MRARISLSLAVLAISSSAQAAGPSIAVHTKDGSVYYGELVERVVDDHLTILNAAGEIKRFKMKDIDPAPAPEGSLYRPPVPVHPPTGTVRTKDGGVFWGEILERVPGDHVTLRLVGGATRVIAWPEIDMSVPPPAYSPPRPPGPTATIRTKKGDVYHGDLVERVIGDHVTLTLVTGAVVTIPWEDVQAPPVARRPTLHDVLLTFDPQPSSARLERRVGVGWETLCAGSCEEVASPRGTYRVSGNGLVASDPFSLSRTSDNHVSATLASSARHTVALALTIGSIPVALAGIVVGAAAASADGYSDKTGIDTAAVCVNLTAVAMLATGIVLLATHATSVNVNGETVARSLAGVVRF